MKAWLRLLWHFGGVAAAAIGAALIAGYPGALIVLGVWAVAGTMYDQAMGR